jgi:hypothetical protein
MLCLKKIVEQEAREGETLRALQDGQGVDRERKSGELR